MQFNLDDGTDFQRLSVPLPECLGGDAAACALLVAAVEATVNEVITRSPDTRAQAAAKVIAQKKPHLISFQECSTWYSVANGVPTTLYDCWSTLNKTLVETYHLWYDLIASDAPKDITLECNNHLLLPSATHGLIGVKSLEGLLVLRATTGARICDVSAKPNLDIPDTLVASFETQAGCASHTLKCANMNWNANHHLIPLQFCGAHFSPPFVGTDAAQQATVIFGALKTPDRTTIFAGDINSAAPKFDPKVVCDPNITYTEFIADGWADSWLVSNAHAAPATGWTWGTDLEDDQGQTPGELYYGATPGVPFERIDMIFSLAHPGKCLSQSSTTVGKSALSETVGGLLPSDHYGVYTRFLVNP